MVRSEFGTAGGEGVDGWGEGRRRDSAVHVGFLVLVEDDFSAELGDLGGLLSLLFLNLGWGRRCGLLFLVLLYPGWSSGCLDRLFVRLY